MAITFPELTRLSNGATGSYASYEANQLRGTALQIDTFDSASLAKIGSGDYSVGQHNLGKRSLGTIVSTTGANPAYYIYSPDTVDSDKNISGSNWTTLSNWSKIATSDTSDNLVANQITASDAKITGDIDIIGNITIGGASQTFGDANSDNVSFGADVNSNFIPNTDATFDLGTSAQRWNDLWIDDVNATNISASGYVTASDVVCITGSIGMLIADNLSVGGGGLNGVTIGSSVSASGDFTTISASKAYLEEVTIGKGGGSRIQDTSISGSTGDFSSVKVGDLTNTRIPYVSDTTGELSDTADMTYSGNTTTIARLVNNNFTSSNVDISGGEIDGVTIGANSAAAGTFTSLSVSDGNISNVGVLSLDTLSPDSATVGLILNFGGNTGKNKIQLQDNQADALSFKSGSASWLKFVTTTGAVNQKILIQQSSSFAGQNIIDLGSVTTADINGGTIDGTTIGGNEAAAGTFTTINAVGITDTGTTTLSTVDINGGAIDGVTIGGSDAAAGTFDTLTVNNDVVLGSGTDDSTTVSGHLTVNNGITIYGDVTNIDATNLQISDQFILLGSGSASGDRGVVFQTTTDFSGSAFVYDDSAKRFGLTKEDSVAVNATTATPSDLIATVSQSTSSPISASIHQNPTFGVDAATRRGQIHIQTAADDNGEDGDIWIYS